MNTFVPSGLSTGSLSGDVRDSSGRAVIGASVRVSSTSQLTQTTSDEAGRYCFAGLAPGSHALVVEKDGYAQGMYVGLTVNAGHHTVANAVLNLRLIRWITLHDETAFGNARQGAGAYAVGSASHRK